MAGEFRAGSVLAKMILDRTQWKKSVGDAKKESAGLGGAIQKHGASIRKVGMAMTAVGGAIVGSLALMIKGYAAAGDEIDKMSRRTSISATTLSELAYAAQIAGTDLSSVEKATKKMSKSIVDAGDGLATYLRVFDRIGLSVEELMTLNPEEQFLKIGNAIAAVENPTVRAAAAVDIFGRAGTQLLPLFDEGPKGLEALRKEAHKLGYVFDKETAAAAARLVDAQLKLKTSMQGVGRSIAETFVPMLSDLAEKAAKVISKITEWMKKNPGLTKTILAIVAGLGGLMLVLGPILIVLPGIVTAVGLMSAGFIAALGPIALITAAVAALTIGFLKVKDAQKKAQEASDNYEKNAVKLKNKLYDMRIALGLNYQEWSKLNRKYKENYAVMANAIRQGKEGKEMQEALAKVSKESKKAYDKQKGSTEGLTGAFKELIPPIKTVKEEVKSWVDYMKELGIKTVKEKQDRVTELKKYLDELHKAYRDGKIDLGDYEAAVKSAKAEIENLSTSITTTVLPAARDMGGVMEQATGEMKDQFFEVGEKTEDLGKKIKETTQIIQIRFKSMTEHILDFARDLSTGWASALTDMLGVSELFTYQVKEFDDSYHQGAIQNAEDAYEKKKQWIMDNITDEEARKDALDKLEKSHQLNMDKIREDEDVARQKHADDELARQESLWNKVKGVFGQAVESMLQTWMTDFIHKALLGVTDKLIPALFSIGEEGSKAIEVVGETGGTVLGGVGKIISDLGKGIGTAIEAIGKGIAAGAKAVAAAAPAIMKVAAMAIAIYAGFKVVSGLIGKIFGAGKGTGAQEYANKILIDIRDNVGAFNPKIDETNRLLVGFYGKYDTMLSQLYQIRDATKGTLAALTTQGTVYVDVFRSAVFESVGVGISDSIGLMGSEVGGAISDMGGELGGAIDGMGREMGGAIKGIDFPDFDPGRIADEFAKRMPEAGGGGTFTSPGPVMTHGTIANPEIIGTARQLSEAGIGGGGAPIVNQTVVIEGNVINSRDFTRNDLIPEILDALDAKVKKSEFQDKLGIR